MPNPPSGKVAKAGIKKARRYVMSHVRQDIQRQRNRRLILIGLDMLTFGTALLISWSYHRRLQ